MQCFQKDPLRRISAVELLKHPWLKQAQNVRAAEMQTKILEAKATPPPSKYFVTFKRNEKYASLNE